MTGTRSHRAWPLILGLHALAAALVLPAGYILRQDSVGYLEGAIFRAPLYPFLLSLATAAGTARGLTLVFLLQLLAVLYASASLVLFLRRELALPNWLAALASLFLLAPILGLRIANAIVTEALGYAFFLLALRHLLDAVLNSSQRAFILHLAMTGLAVLTRPQFLFVYPVSALALVYVSARARSRRATLVLAGALLASLLLTDLLDRTYRYVHHGLFSRAPFTGLQLMAPALYLSTPEDARRFAAPEASLFTALHAQAEAAGVVQSANPHPRGLGSFARHYSAEYNTLVWDIIVPTFARQIFQAKRLDAPGYVAMDDMLLPMAKTLILGHPRAYLRLYVSNIADRLGSNYGLVLATALLVALGSSWRHRDRVATAFAAVAVLHLANYGLVAAVEPLWVKYSLYTDFPLLALFVVLLVQTAGPRAADPDVRHRG